MEMQEERPSNALAQYTEAAHAHLIGLPGALDLKISIVTSVLVGVLVFALLIFGRAYGPPGQVHAAIGWSLGLSLCGIGLLVLAIGFGGYALHFHAHGSHDNPFSAHGFAAHANGAAMLAALKERSPQQLLEDRLLHCRDVAIVSVLKGQWFHRALLCGLAGVVLVGQGVIFK